MAKFFHTPRAKKFRYEPRYYNEMTEKRKERENRILKEIEAEKEGKTYGVTKEHMSNYIQLTRKTKKKSNMRLLVILVLLFVIVYYFFM